MAAVRVPSRRALAVVVAALAAVSVIPLAARAVPAGPALDIAGVEPGTEKERIVRHAQRETDEAAASTPGPVRGRPAEAWKPPIEEGILDTLESPFEGRPFVLVNAWQSRLSPDGRVTRVYAGTEGERSLLIVLRQVLQTGERELLREILLPVGVGAPRLVAIRDGVLDVSTAAGGRFRFDVARVEVRAAPVR